MAVNFKEIPSDIRVPLFYAEIDNSAASNFSQNLRALTVGQRLAAGTIPKETPVLVTSVDQAKQFFGNGSQLARMVETFKAGNDFTELWCVALDDDGAAVAATGTFAVTGTATEAGTLNLYVAGDRVKVPVASGDTATVVGDAIVTALTAGTNLPVTAANSLGTVTATARNKGESGNGIDLRVNFAGELGGERTPAGLSITVTAMSGGTTNPDVALAHAVMGDEPYEYICQPYTDTTSLNAWRDFMGASTSGRWNALKQLYGHVFSAKVGTVSALDTFGDARNDEHMSIIGYFDSPTQSEKWAAAFTAQAAFHLSIDPARPLQTLPLVGVKLPPDASRFTLSERNLLLFSGVTTPLYSGGFARIERAITTYQTNAFSQPDASYLDVNTLSTLARIVRELRSVITQKFPRHKLANDGTRFGAGQAIVTPNILKAEIVSLYDRLETLGLVENADKFVEHLIVERDLTDPNRVNVLLPPDLINQLRIFAARVQFRLQFN